MIQTQTQSESINELLSALCKAQGKIRHAVKNNKNSFFKDHTYADLNSIWEACRDHLTSNGISIIQSPQGTKDEMYLVTILGHSSGQWIKSYYPIVPIKQDPQGIGSAITYARRYSLSAMVGICADEDDDAENAMGRNGKKTVANDLRPPSNEQQEVEEFIRLIPPQDKEIAAKYIQKVCETKKMKILDVIKICKEDMEKFKKNLNTYKESLAA